MLTVRLSTKDKKDEVTPAAYGKPHTIMIITFAPQLKTRLIQQVISLVGY